MDPKLHIFSRQPAELPDKLNNPFCYEPHPLCVESAALICAYVEQSREMSLGIARRGKMFGTLVVESVDGVGFLAACSGNSPEGEGYFVPPVFDISAGFYRIAEAEISAINRKIATGDGNDVELRKKRAEMSAALQRRLFDNYFFLNEGGEFKNIRDIFAEFHSSVLEIRAEERRKAIDAARNHTFYTPVSLPRTSAQPPSAAGDCAAPKLLQYAFSNNLKPLAIAEFWLGPENRVAGREQGHFYPSCLTRCLPILSYMLSSDFIPTVALCK